MKRIGLITMVVFFSQLAFGQFPENELKKKLNADIIEMDLGNEDGVFKARNQKTKKWGMYQWMYSGVETDELIPMDYDSVSYIPFNGAFSAVYNNGKVGFHLSAWSFTDAKQTVPCLYDSYQKYNIEHKTYLAVSRNDKWGWVDWKTGEEKSEFIYATKEDLPYPNY